MDSLLAHLGALPDVMSTPLHLPATGDVLADNFQILGPLASGGMSTVMLARDLRLGRTVVIKLIRQRAHITAERLLLFEREARATARLQHPNIVTIHTFGVWRGTPFMVLEHLKGESLATRLERGALPANRAADVMHQVLEGLGHAHSAGIVHRDLKPGNIFLEDSGRVVLLDFGIAEFNLDRSELLAALWDSEHDDILSPGPRFAGTPAYMAPEQLRGEPADTRSDVWAAGVLFFKMLSGRLPLRTQDDILDPGLDIPTLGDDIPALLSTWTSNALRRTPSDRPDDANTLLDALKEAEESRHTLHVRRQRRLRRVLGSLFALLLVGGLVAWNLVSAHQRDVEASQSARLAQKRIDQVDAELRRAEYKAERATEKIHSLRMAELFDAMREVRGTNPALVLELARVAAYRMPSPYTMMLLEVALNNHHERVRVHGTILDVSPDGSHFLIASEEVSSYIHIRHMDAPHENIATVSISKQYNGHLRRRHITFTSDSRHVIAIDSGSISIFDLDANLLMSEPLDHDPVHDFELSPENDRLITFGAHTADLYNIRWNVREISHLRRFEGLERCSGCTAFSPSNSHLLLSSEDGTRVKVLSRWGHTAGSLKLRKSESVRNAFSEDGRHVVTHRGSRVRVWALDGTLEHTLDVGSAEKDGLLLSSGHYFSVKDGSPFGRGLGRTDPIPFATSLAPSPGALDEAHTKPFWEHTFWSPDGKLAHRVQDGSVVFWDRDGAFLGSTDGPVPERGTFSPDGHHIAFWYKDDSRLSEPILVWNTAGDGFREMELHTGGSPAKDVFFADSSVVVVTREALHVFALDTPYINVPPETYEPSKLDALLRIAAEWSTHTLTDHERATFDIEDHELR